MDVMAAPALSCSLSLLVLLLALAIPRGSTVANGEDPGIWIAMLSLGEEANTLREALSGPLLLAEAHQQGQEAGKEGGEGVHLLPWPFRPVPAAPMCLPTPKEDTGFSCPLYLGLPAGPCRLWGSVLSSLKWIH